MRSTRERDRRSGSSSRAGRSPRRPRSLTAGLLRFLNRRARRDRRRDRPAEVGVCDRARAQVRGAGPARLSHPQADDSRRVGRIHVVAGGRERQGLLRQRRRERLRGRREERRAAWKFATGDVVHASPAVAGNTVYVGSWDSTLYAIDAESGAEVDVRGRAGSDAPQPGRLPVVARRGRRDGLRRLPRRARLRARRRHRPQEVGLPDEQVVGERHARGARRHGVRRHVGHLALHGARRANRPAQVHVRRQGVHLLFGGARRRSRLLRQSQRPTLLRSTRRPVNSPGSSRPRPRSATR